VLIEKDNQEMQSNAVVDVESSATMDNSRGIWHSAGCDCKECAVSQEDWVGGTSTSRVFKDEPNRRASDAQEKAELLFRLGNLVKKAPPFLANAGVIETRQFVKAMEECKKVAAKKNATKHELQSAVSRMEGWQR